VSSTSEVDVGVRIVICIWPDSQPRTVTARGAETERLDAVSCHCAAKQ
jgi:hypothetical protein